MNSECINSSEFVKSLTDSQLKTLRLILRNSQNRANLEITVYAAAYTMRCKEEKLEKEEKEEKLKI